MLGKEYNLIILLQYKFYFILYLKKIIYNINSLFKVKIFLNIKAALYSIPYLFKLLLFI